MAQDLLDNNENIQNIVSKCIDGGYTPVFELVGPNNVIVLRYNEDKLVLLGEVDNKNGQELPVNGNGDEDGGKVGPLSYDYTWTELLDIQNNSQDNIEGFVVVTNDKNHPLVKIKTKKYVSLHRLKDSINNLKTLCTLILDDNIDDLIGSFQDDQKTIDYILEKQEEISHKYNHLVQIVEDFYNKNKKLNRKYYAIKAQHQMKDKMGLLMDIYSNKEPRYKEFFIKTKMYEGV
jgi:T4 RnlA family RNA ligase